MTDHADSDHDRHQHTIDALKTAFPGLAVSEFRGQTRVVVAGRVALRRAADAQGAARLRSAGRCDVRRLPALPRREGPLRAGLSAGQHARRTSGSRCGRFVNDPEPTVPSVVGLVGRGELAGARGVGHVRHPLRRPSRPAADRAARGVHGPSAAQGLSACKAAASGTISR